MGYLYYLKIEMIHEDTFIDIDQKSKRPVILDRLKTIHEMADLSIQGSDLRPRGDGRLS